MWLNNPHLSSVRAATALGPKSFRAWTVVALSCCFIVSAAPARAADLIEPWAPGLTDAELDLWGELQMQTATMEAELGAADRAVGFEWSAPSRWSRGVQTYVRFSAARSGGATHLHPLVGFRIATRTLVDLHVELSGEEPDSGPWPLHLAIGPNLPLNGWLEVVPEIAVIDDRAPGGETTVAFSLGVVTDPSAWLGGFGAIGPRFGAIGER